MGILGAALILVAGCGKGDNSSGLDDLSISPASNADTMEASVPLTPNALLVCPQLDWAGTGNSVSQISGYFWPAGDPPDCSNGDRGYGVRIPFIPNAVLPSPSVAALSSQPDREDESPYRASYTDEGFDPKKIKVPMGDPWCFATTVLTPCGPLPTFNPLTRYSRVRFSGPRAARGYLRCYF